MRHGAGEGNRTLVVSLEGFCSTIELHPHRSLITSDQLPTTEEVVGEVGLEPTKAKPADLQSAPFAARDTPPLAVEPLGISGSWQANRQHTERLPRVLW